MATIKFTVGTDPLTGKKQKYTNNEVRIRNGIPIEFNGTMSFHELNDDQATPPGSSERQKKSVESYTENFAINSITPTKNPDGLLHIDSVTKQYVEMIDGGGYVLQSDMVTPPANPVMSLADYFALKALNSFPGTAGSDPLWGGIEGLCKEMIAIRQANGSLPM